MSMNEIKESQGMKKTQNGRKKCGADLSSIFSLYVRIWYNITKDYQNMKGKRLKK